MPNGGHRRPRKTQKHLSADFVNNFDDPFLSQECPVDFSLDNDLHQPGSILVPTNSLTPGRKQFTLVTLLSLAIRYILQLSSQDERESNQRFQSIISFLHRHGLIDWSALTLSQLLDTRPQYENAFIQLLTVANRKQLKATDLNALSLIPVPSYSRQSSNNSLVEFLNLSKNSWYQQNFEELGQLGRGAFGVVYKVKNRLDGNCYAIKTIKLRQLDVHELHRVQREVATLCRLDHGNIVRYQTSWTEWQPKKLFSKQSSIVDSSSGQSSDDGSYGAAAVTRDLSDCVEFDRSYNGSSPSLQEATTSSTTNARSSKLFQSDIVLYIQMQLCDLSLSEHLEERNELTDRHHTNSPYDAVDDAECHSIFRQLLRGLSYLHFEGILHRDIKSSNIFLQTEFVSSGAGKYRVRIGDFGLARKSIDSHTPRSDPAHLKLSLVGTASYQSPELRAGRVYDHRTDLFSLGVLLFELYQPFTSGHEKQHLMTKLRTEHSLPDSLALRFAQESQVILELTDPEPFKRPSAADLLQRWNFAHSKRATIDKLLKELEIERSRRVALEEEIAKLKGNRN